MTITELKTQEKKIREREENIEAAFVPYSRENDAEYIRQTNELCNLEKERMAIVERIAMELLSRHLVSMLANS